MSGGKNSYRLAILWILLLGATPVFGASVLSVGPSGNGTFVLRGNGLIETAIIDVEISYDSASLANPRITQGALVTGAMTAANVDVPGVVRLSIIPAQAINGNGAIAYIAFNKTGEASGKINTLTGRITNKSGKSVPLSFSVENPPEYSSGSIGEVKGQTTPQVATQSSAPPPPPVAGTDGGAQYPFVVGGNLTLPSPEETAKNPPLQETHETAKDIQQVAATPTGEPSPKDIPKVDPPKVTAETSIPESVMSVLEQVRLFEGPHTVASLTGLFEPSKISRFRQDPAVVLADGKNTVKVSIQKIAGTHAPNFAFTSAQAVSWDISGDVWLVETKPVAGALKSSVSVLVDGIVHTFPLVVSPIVNVDLDRSGAVTEGDFRLFLKERGTGSTPKFDLNGDGKSDYLDDYIFTANYLATKLRTPEKRPEGGNSLNKKQ